MTLTAITYPEGGYIPTWAWSLMQDLSFVVALVAAISAVMWVWRRGPGLLIAHGPEWMTELGEWWYGRRGVE